MMMANTVFSPATPTFRPKTVLAARPSAPLPSALRPAAASLPLSSLSLPCRRARLVARSSEAEDPTADEDEEEWEGLTEEEDWVVPGNPNDSLSSNTELGRAVRAACDELDQLGRLEADVQSQAEDLLRKLGYKGESLTRERPPEKQSE
mmetsp:Transcript_28989/g.81660  ORF Transcript_28989/g.81660 Transcript_28989/m.81660 type:complete len:149 (-) Transcript_28989:183-629(-)